MRKRQFLFIWIIVSTITACTEIKKDTQKGLEKDSLNLTHQVILSSEIKWEKLNPARGEQSPQAGTIWGDRKGKVATGFLAKFIDGFSSPPHIHNVSYRAIVLAGLIHNDDPKAEKMWMSGGSFWTQPAGQPHITAAKGKENIAYVEIDSGPYLVKPVEEAFDTGEKPVNIDANNIVWVDASQTQMIDKGKSKVELAFLWEDDNMTGNLIKLPASFQGDIFSKGEQFQALLISGELSYIMPQSEEIKVLDSGSYFTSKGNSEHKIRNDGGSETVIYIRTDREFFIK